MKPIQDQIVSGETYLGIELGSTRIKACLIGEGYAPIAAGAYAWENRFENGYWTYSLDEVRAGLAACFADLASDVRTRYGVELGRVGAMGISGMMHGYLAFDKEGNLLAPFRTWRNTTTAKAAAALTEAFAFNVPQRWSIAHLYEAMLNREEHVGQIAHITTLAGYVHELLTGRRELGICDASGMFPLDGAAYDVQKIATFERLAEAAGYKVDLTSLLPRIRLAGERGAVLTEEGARLLDPTGTLRAGVAVCPPEGDGGTGMVATNAVRKKTGNVSAGTSIFAMLVLDRPMKHYYPEIDVVTTPDGAPVAMVHCNNCSGELDAWVGLLHESAQLLGASVDRSSVYETLYRHALTGDADGGGLVAYNYLSGEHITGVHEGRPMCARCADTALTLANFMRAQLYSSMATLSLGMDILQEREGMSIDTIQAHGGLFKVKGVAQQFLADALNTPVSTMETAGEGGAWGMALLAAYMMDGDTSLSGWLDSRVFGTFEKSTLSPTAAGVEGFKCYMERYRRGLDAEKALAPLA